MQVDGLILDSLKVMYYTDPTFSYLYYLYQCIDRLNFVAYSGLCAGLIDEAEEIPVSSGVIIALSAIHGWY